MSALGGAAGIALALIAEEVIVTSRGGPTAIAGAFGSATRLLDRFADPTVPGIPDLTLKSNAAMPPITTPALPGQAPTANPVQGRPGLPVRDYNPSQLVPQGSSGLL